ncbi:precorrin-2 dehydrogenase/sirohydrochlorin ferrochelatase family protein [Gorillibacterium timonense]|uniref:precorrin-2 dehydrogenase/sirohydrochlorin ferrochelatase family protein n=1 Tax=Gorillibacterium timonense TaxID=1689269 RepID=UPI00071C934D|nr:bifunctional precorrin-2 dehydrogenase/sirohydrochlorin ferrochelatase [Gorillibacterium timonense]
MTESSAYPLILKLDGKRCLVVGGGSVAERKTASLLASGASVKVISPEVRPAFAFWAEEGVITLVQREYRPGDAAESGALLVFAATGDREVNRRVCAEAEEAGQLCNSADDPQAGSFTVPASVRRGELLIAVSTSGASPTAARSLAAEIAERYGDEYAEYMKFLREVRERVLAGTSDPALRSQLLKEASDEAALAAIRSGAFEKYREEAFARLKERLEI